MEGRITSIEGGWKAVHLTVVVGLSDIELETKIEKMGVRDRIKFKEESSEYKDYLTRIDKLLEGIHVGDVEIKYVEKK